MELWKDPSRAQNILKEKRSIEIKLSQFNQFQNELKDNLELANLAGLEGDEQMLDIVEESLQALCLIAAKFETECLFAGSEDGNNCFLEINAFTAGGNEIFINSGLINQFPDIDVLRGVIAHEIGHILGKHIIRQLENIDIYNKVALSSIAIGLASAATGNSSLGSAIALGGMHFSERSILSYSRAFESSADQTALKLLEQSGNSSIGMIKFFEYMKIQHSNRFANPYDQTHPLSQERLVALKDFYQKSKFKNSKNSKELEYKFSRSAAKLLAFTTTTPKKLLTHATTFSPEISNYIKAICYFRMSDLNNSLQNINKLLSSHPNDPFYNELKGQILFEFGKKEALGYYIAASKVRPNDLLIKLGKAIVGITIYSNEPAKNA